MNTNTNIFLLVGEKETVHNSITQTNFKFVFSLLVFCICISIFVIISPLLLMHVIMSF